VTETKQRFKTGKIVATPGAIELLENSEADAFQLLGYHVCGLWGDLSAEDSLANEEAIETGLRILSSYALRGGKLWIITEGDRSATTLLLPEEY
jgi:hypothetical protein